MKEALLYEKLEDQKVRCNICQRQCTISPGKTGFCLTKINRNGKLYTINYGLLSNPPSADPIEKKPLYHFLPGTRTFSIGSFGCNYRCKQCLNWWCSWGEPATTVLKQLKKQKDLRRFPTITPEQLVKAGIESGLKSLAFTYNEPVIWLTFALDVAKLAQKKKLKTIYVTNGSWTQQNLDTIGPYLDAANIDFKGFSRKTYAKMDAYWGKLLQTTKYAQSKHNIFLELTTVLIPGINTDPEELKKMADWIVKNLGPKTPWHLSRYSTDRVKDKEFAKIPQTSQETLKKAEKIGRRQGLEFVYIWAPGIDFNGGVFAKGNTVCPKCGTLAIRRDHWKPKILTVDQNGKCTKCGENLNLRIDSN